MKIPKLFKKAAAFLMAAVTALSIMPATAFAAGDIGTISFSHTYDSNGNAMRYNSSANIGGYTAGGTGNYKYRMFVDGENAFCIQPGVPLKTGNTLKKASSDTWNALSANQKKAVGLALLYGYQGNRNNLSGSDDEKWLATQTLVWEFVTGCREATGSYNQTSTTVYSLHFGSNYANSGARAVYDQIVAMLREHNTIPSFMSGGKNDITKELALTQLGNEGGQPYWSWYGFEGRVEWCACFVSWCADQCGYIESGIIQKFAGCVDGSNWFKGNGQWQDRNYEPQAGDIIFFDWEGDGETDHVGIVEKCENGVVYTVEGNSGDACRQKQYTVGSSSIYGYGVPAY